jgi:hypothetical protein
MKAIAIVSVLCGVATAAPRPAKLVATFDSMVVVGEQNAARVRAHLAAASGKLAACLGADGPTTTEISLSIVKHGIDVRGAWQGDAAVMPPCLRKVFPAARTRAWATDMTTVYVVVKAGPEGSTWTDAPVLEDRRAAFERLFCAGEDAATVKHPAPVQLASDVTMWPAEDRDRKRKKAIQAEGIKKCAQQGW